MSIRLTRAQADAVIGAPKRANTRSPEWVVAPSAITGSVLAANLLFAVTVAIDEVELQQLLVTGQLAGDASHCIRLAMPRSNRSITRLCNAAHHPGGGHWHHYGDAVLPPEVEEPEPLLTEPASTTDRDHMLAIFCERLSITGTFRQRSLEP